MKIILKSANDSNLRHKKTAMKLQEYCSLFFLIQ